MARGRPGRDGGPKAPGERHRGAWGTPLIRWQGSKEGRLWAVTPLRGEAATAARARAIEGGCRARRSARTQGARGGHREEQRRRGVGNGSSGGATGATALAVRTTTVIWSPLRGKEVSAGATAVNQPPIGAAASLFGEGTRAAPARFDGWGCTPAAILMHSMILEKKNPLSLV